MRQLTHGQAQRRIARVFVDGAANGTDMASLYTHLSGCTACAQLYRRYQELERRLCPTPAAANQLLLERAAVSALARASDGPAGGRAKSRVPFLGFWVGVATSAAAAALVVAFLVLAPTERQRALLAPDSSMTPIAAELVHRGAKEASADVGIRLFRVESSASVHESAALTLDDIITFTYTNARPSLGYLMLFGVQSDGAIRWYYPDDGAESIKVASGVIDQPLGDGIRLRVYHEAGPLQVVALFSERPIESTRARAVVGSVSHLPTPALAAALAESGQVIEHSLLVEIAPAAPDERGR